LKSSSIDGVEEIVIVSVRAQISGERVELKLGVFEKFAKKYLDEASKDLERAKRAFELSDYPQAVFYAQQCTEKAVKAMLEVKRRVVYNHGPELIGLFVEVFEDEWSKDFEDVVEALEYLTEYYTRARYPFLLRGEVLGPEDVVDREVAVKGLERAKKALEVARNYLRARGVV
jgi:HEPN domain-containing protein